MAKISAASFANSVDENRKRLIQHCRDNKVEVSDTASLDKVVDVTRGINFPADDKPIKVEILDIDCSEIVPTYYVEKGADVVLPDIIPNFDEEHLEFGSWAISGGDELTNVQRNITCMPHYKTRYDESIGQRPTYVQCYFDDTTLKPTINFSAIPTNTYIDWGDGSSVEQVTAKTIAHTYSVKGFYWIKIYGDKYSLGGGTYGLFGSDPFKYCAIKIYLGEKNTLAGLNSHMNLECLVFDTYGATIPLPKYFLSYSTKLKSVIVPNGVTYLDDECFRYGYGLKKIILPNTLTGMNKNNMSYMYRLEEISLPKSLSKMNEYSFYTCPMLKELVIPDSVTTIGGYVLNTIGALKKLVLSENLTSFGASNSLGGCYNLEELRFPPKITTSVTLGNAFSLKKLYIPKYSGSMTIVATQAYNLSEIILEDGHDCSLSFSTSPLTKDCLIDIANKIKDNTGLTARTLTLSPAQCKLILNTTYLNAFGGEVPYGTEGAVTLMEFIQNKNWTVSIS